MFFAAISLLCIALLLFGLAYRQQKSAGLPGGKVVYSDTRDWGSVDKPFYDPMLGLTGKPDYVIKKGNQLIPVEVKSSQITGSPF